MKQQPFRRLNKKLSVAAEQMSKTGCSLESALALQDAYRSRGKNRTSAPKARRGKHMDAVRAARSARNKVKRK